MMQSSNTICFLKIKTKGHTVKKSCQFFWDVTLWLKWQFLIHFLQQPANRSCAAQVTAQCKVYLNWLQCRRPESSSTSLVRPFFIHMEKSCLFPLATHRGSFLSLIVSKVGNKDASANPMVSDCSQLLLEWQETDSRSSAECSSCATDAGLNLSSSGYLLLSRGNLW